MGALSDHDGDTVRHVDAVVEQLFPLVGVVGRKLNVRDAHGIQHLCCEVVPSGIGRQTEGEVGIKRVVADVLQSVGLHFGVEADPSSFLAEVDNGAVTGFLDGLHGRFELGAAIAALGPKGVTGQAFGMDADKRGAFGQIANEEDAVFFTVARVAKGSDFELAVFGGEQGFRFGLCR